MLHEGETPLRVSTVDHEAVSDAAKLRLGCLVGGGGESVTYVKVSTLMLNAVKIGVVNAHSSFCIRAS